MDVLPVAILSILGTITLALTFTVLFFRTRHRERLALIKYGKDASIFRKDKHPGNSTLKWALLLMGGGLGFFIGTIIDGIFNSEPAVTFAMLMFFGGGALFVYYNYINKYGDIHRDHDKEDDLI